MSSAGETKRRGKNLQQEVASAKAGQVGLTVLLNDVEVLK